MVFVFTMTPGSTLFNIVKPVSAATLTSVKVIPDSNVNNERATYNLFLKTATTGTIKTIQINFPSSFNLADISLLEKSNIGSGSLSFTGSTMKYTVNSAASVPAGTTIELEVGRIIAENAGTFTVSMRTLNSGAGIIDGPTTSGSFIIKQITGSDISKSITGDDISPSFMIRKTLNDGTGGWVPNGIASIFTISDNDVFPTGTQADSTFVSVMNRFNDGGGCTVSHFDPGQFRITCTSAPSDNAQLHYVITKLPANVVTSSSLSVSSSIPSSPFDSLQTDK